MDFFRIFSLESDDRNGANNQKFFIAQELKLQLSKRNFDHI